MDESFLCNKRFASTVTLLGALVGYGSHAYGACANIAGTTYQCSGTNNTTQSINANNVDVGTVAGFSIDTTSSGGDALEITGNGALLYTDTKASPLISAAGTALSIQSNGDSADTAGGVTVNTKRMRSLPW